MKKILLLFIYFSFLYTQLSGQQIITGKVSNVADGLGLPGVSVSVKDTSLGTVTDMNGKYYIDAPADTKVLVFSFVGFKTTEIEIESNIINVSLEPSEIVIEEIVVTSLGISREKKSLGYAIQELESEEIANSARTNMIDAINAKVAGVQIQNSGGQAGGGASMIIRGFTSVNYSNQPLFVVDGVPINNNVAFHSGSGTPSANRAIDIDPNQIKSISILKGGAATALYGIRAGNGAVIITTKQGKKGGGGLAIEYNFTYSLDKPFHLHELSSEYARGRDGAYSNVSHWSWGPRYSTNPSFPAGTSLDLNGDGTNTDVSGQAIPQYNDNYSRFWQNGASKNHSLSFSGGSETGTFFAAVSRLNQDGITPNQDYDKSSFIVNVSQKIKNKLTIIAKANYINSGGKRFRTATGILRGFGVWHNMWDVNAYPWKNEATGYKTWFSGGVPHPQWVVNEEGEDWRLNRMIGNLGFEYAIAPWLNINYTAGVDAYSENRVEVTPYGSVTTAGNLGDMMVLKIDQIDFNQDLILSGKRNITSNLDISYLAGGNIWQTTYNSLLSEGTQFVLKEFYNLNNTVEIQSSTYTSGKILYGLYGDVTLGYKNYLYLGITGRNDWSSTLPKENNSFFYPSVNLGFILSELINIPGFDYLKIRGSYSQMANDAPTMALADVFDKNDPNIFDNPRFTISDTHNNPDLKPERTNEIEIGIELRAIKNILGLDLALYNRTSLDQIIHQPVSTTTGYSTKLINLGEVNNKGIEATISIINPIKLKDFTWNTYINFTKNVGKVVSLGESTDDDLDRVILASGWWANAQIIAIEGQPMGTIIGTHWTRYGDNIDPESSSYLNNPLLIDDEGKPIVNSNPVILGNINPNWVMGLSSDLKYKGINFGFTLERRKGGDMINGFEANTVYSGLSSLTDARWYDGAAADGSDGTSNATQLFEGFHADGEANKTLAHLDHEYWSGRYRKVDEELVQDGSWWRLRTLYIGYSLPENLLLKTFIKTLNITFTGRNLWLNTSYRGNDPELSYHGVGNFQGFDDLVSPGTRSYLFGISATF